jgi:hypothetical protein
VLLKIRSKSAGICNNAARHLLRGDKMCPNVGTTRHNRPRCFPFAAIYAVCIANRRVAAHTVHSESVLHRIGHSPISEETSLDTTHVSAQASPSEKRHFFLQIHGIYHRNNDGSSRQKVIRSCAPGEILQFVSEPDNHYDPNAIKACRSNGQQLGYLDSGNAARISHDMTTGWTIG